MENDDRVTAENERRMLSDSLVIKAELLEPGQFDEGKEILSLAHAGGCLSSTKARLIGIMVRRTKILFPAYSAALREIEHSHPAYGLVQTVPGGVKALHAHFTSQYGKIIFANNCSYGYVDDKGNDHVGIYMPITSEKLDKTVSTLFPFPAWASKRSRDELINAFQDSCRDDGAFGRATPGLALRDGFLTASPTGRVTKSDFSPDHYARSKLHVFFDTDASAPRVKKKLLRAFGGDVKKVELFLSYLSCAVFGQMPVEDRLRTCLLLVGPMRTGKSTLIRIARMLFSEFVLTSTPPENWGKPEYINGLATSSLNTVSELSAQRKLNGNNIKMILSGEPVLARRLYHDAVSILPRGLNIWAGNALPRLDEQDASLGRRFAIIHMGASLTDEEASESLEDIVGDEIAGVINLLVEAHERVMTAKRFTLVEGQQESLSRMQYGDDVIANFVHERVVRRPGARVTTAALKLEIPRFARTQGETEPLMTATDLKRFSSMVKNLYGAERRASNGKPQYDGIALVSGDPATDEVGVDDGGLDGM